MNVSGVNRQLIGVVRMVDQSGAVEVNVLDKDRSSSDNTNGVLTVGGVGEIYEVGGRAVVVSNI
eukprot:1112942-Prorocentrum_minimum.AAC.1